MLVGLDISPTFTTGAFTGVTRIPLRIVFGSNYFGVSNIIADGITSLHAAAPTTTNYFIRSNNSNIIFNSPATDDMFFRVANNDRMRLFGTTGNFLIQNGGTFTDAGFRLDVNGTARIQNQLTTTGSITAASAIARGVYMNQTLVAAANSDVLVGLDINPTFTAGAFTGTKQIAMRLNNAIQFTGTPTSLSDTNTIYGNSLSTTFVMAAGPDPISASSNGGFFLLRGNTYSASGGQRGWTVIAAGLVTSPTGNEGCISLMVGNTSEKFRIFPNGNHVIQNGGTFTDNGFRLDVQGTVRVSNVLTLGSLASDPTGANGMIYYNTTSNTFKVYQNGAWRTVTAI
jgi:hypothetical protein